jgi:hypothetical protein
MGERVMRKLDLSEWAHVAEIAGTIGVVVSLLLVVYSLERNTVSVSGSGVNEIYDGMREIQIAVLTDRELSEIIVQGREDPESLTTAEAMAYETWVAIHLDLWDRLHNRESEGLIDSEASAPWHGFFREWTRRYVSREQWRQWKWGWPVGSFQAQVEAVLDH